MSWFENRVQNWKTRLPGDVGGRSFPWRDPGPPLKVLIPEGSDSSSYELHTFGDAIDATAFFDDRFQGRITPGVVSFWAMQQDPDPGQSDIVVLIDAHPRPGTVYSFTFPNIGAAMAFLRKEFALGLDVGSAEVYYAVPLLIELLGNGQFRMPRGPMLGQHAGAPESAAFEQGTQLHTQSEWRRRDSSEPNDAAPAAAGDPFAGIVADAAPATDETLESPPDLNWAGSTGEGEPQRTPVAAGSFERQEGAEATYTSAVSDGADGESDPLSREAAHRRFLEETMSRSRKEPGRKKNGR